VNRLRFTAGGEVSADAGPGLVSILSGKGGVGKSVIAFNLAERIASFGQRVLLVDTDFTGGNLHILANRECHVGIAGFVEAGLSLGTCVTNVGERIDLLGASSNGTFDAETWSSPTVAKFVSRLRKEAAGYDVVLFDHSSGKSQAATLIAHACDINLLVVVPELTSISDCFGLFKHLNGSKAAIDCRLLINRAQDVEEADFLHKKFGAVTEKFVGRAPRCVGFVLEDQLVRQAVAAQSPMAPLNSNSVAVQSLNRIAQSLLRDLRPAQPVRRSIVESDYNVHPAAADIRE